ncbi:YqiA/YcfP family alpha/beta fold hydrolase [Silvimonas sp.]|uniref:YqiA/YcfP family alpha/beta fold hydrolase n=1 Tax=Silvimonas sp. TaxID=2650811 RepID=UPI00284EDB90|nr:YqiA/YcfP family alpha/beta fold hydrolase [Silvimonas sp.]MDR3429735.1 YqiA/YcfP family alpha/beta fold hydrolase [Silvimonas sp.]
MVHLMYLHGFLSSPFSQKANESAVWMAERGYSDYFHCPQLPMEPYEAGKEIQAALERLHGEQVCFIGSSLGGYFANWAVEEFGGKAVLVNPAVHPYIMIKQYVGQQRNYQTGEIHMIDAAFGEHLKTYERSVSDPSRYWLMVQTGDETLDYRESVTKYAGCAQTVIEGGDHSFQGFGEYLPLVWDFAQGGS